MSLHLYSADVNTRRSGFSLYASKPQARGLRLLLAVLLASVGTVATAQQAPVAQRRVPGTCDFAENGGHASARIQHPGSSPLHLCEGYTLGGPSAQAGHGNPLALASADFDEDGVPDLVAGFATSSTGSITVYRGNIAALWPYGEAIANGTPQAFLLGARTFAVDEAPDLVVTGDFDADGHLDIVTAKRGSSALYFLKGDGHGGFASAKRITVGGVVHDLIAGEMNRPDGLADLVVAVSGPAGNAALVYESPRGALQGQPELFPLAHPAEALALGRFMGGAMLDLAIGGGGTITVVQGRDRHLSTGGVAPSAILTHQALPFGVRALAAGDFTGRGPSIAILGDDGSVHILEHSLAPDSLAVKAAAAGPAAAVGGGGKEIYVPGRSALASVRAQTRATAILELTAEHDSALEWTERSTVALPNGFSQNIPRLVAGRLSGSAQEDLLAIDSSNHQIHVMSTGRSRTTLLQTESAGSVDPAAGLPQMKKLGSLDTANAPVAVLPMRLSQHGLSGLVTLYAGQSAPSLSPQDVPPGSTFTVTNTSDIASAGDTNVPDGSLRAAITAASHAAAVDLSNNNGVASQVFSVVFNIPTTDPGYNATTGIWTIKPLSEVADDPGNQYEDRHALPAIYGGITIDGYTQPGASPNTLIAGDNAKIVIAIDGGNATTPGGDGLDAFDDVGTVIRGLAITGWDTPFSLTDSTGHSTTVGGYGIVLDGEADFIEGNFIGTPDGENTGRNFYGVFVDSGPAFGDTAGGNLIGGTTPQARNVIAANSQSGIFIEPTALQAGVQGNFIGLDSSGTSCLGNLVTGVTGLYGTNTVGGTLAGARNILSCNGNNMDLNDFFDSGGDFGGSFQGNYLGTDAIGTKGLSPNDDGVGLQANVRNYVIGGTTPAARNVISGLGTGVAMSDNVFYVTLQGNYIGTDPTGTIAVPNAYGVYAGRTDASKTYAGYATIGGTVAGSGNVISGNTHDGVILYGSSADNPGYSPYIGSTVLGNFIGTDATGTKSLPNGGNGVYLLAGATNNTIGGTVSGAANMIANNGANGVLIDPGTTDLPGVNNVTIGNIITTNTGAGVRIASGTQNRVSQNSIYGNGALGIDIDATGPSTNTHCNATNSGANNIQNYPVLTAGSGATYISATATDPNGNTSEFSKAVAATKTGNLLSLLGNFDGTASTSFTIEFFSSPTADASGYGQGQTYLGSTTISTDASCNSTISDPIDVTQADVSVKLTNPVEDLIIGPDQGSIIYRAAVANLGPATAHNVTFTDTLPSQLKLSSAYCNVAACQSPIVTSQGACTISGQTITCKLGTMTTGGTASISIPVQVISDGSVTNTATVSATEADPNLLNNTSSPTATSYYPYPSIDHLSVAAALTNSPALELEIFGTGLIPASTVTFNGTSVPVTGLVDNLTCGGTFDPSFCSALQLQIPAPLLATAGTYIVEATNPGGGVADSNFVVASACAYDVQAFLTDLDSSGTDLIAESVYVAANVPTCTWTTTSTLPWVTVLDNSPATGTATVDIAIAANTTTSARSGFITVAGQSVTVSQDAGSASNCSVVLTPGSTSIAAAGGSGSFGVTATPSGCADFVEPYPQNYSYAPNVQWITVPANSIPSNNTVTYTAAPNNGPARIGSITVGGAAYVITQAAPACVFTLSPASDIAPASGGTGTIGVTATPSSCAWTASSSNAAQLSITSGKSGTGDGTVKYTVAANASGPQTPTITVGNSISTSVFTLNQASTTTCTFALSPGTAAIGADGGSGFVQLTASFDFCKWTAASNNPDSLSINGSASGSGTTSILYNVSQNTGAARTLTITAGCQTFTIDQAAAVITVANNPVPTITTLSPTSVTAGAGATTLTVNGTNFINASVVNYNGTAKTTIYVSATRLTIGLLAADVATAGSFPVTVTNPTPGGGTSNSVDFTVNAAVVDNPVPTITTLSPTSVTAGAGATTLTVNGTNFISGSVVNFNGTAKATTYVSANKLTAALLAADVATAGSFPVTVTTSTPGGGISNSVTFTVNAPNNPVPTITSLQPSSVTAGSGATTLTVNGTNFISGSIVDYNGVAKTTTYVSATQLTIGLLATDVATAGSYAVTVTNLTPGGGTSNSVTFTVNAAVVNNPVPTITTLQPTSVTAGAGATTLTVNGTNFISGSTVNYNGLAKTTTYVSATQLTAALPATDVATAGSYPVTVTNPTPGGGTSNSISFTVSAAVVNNPVPSITTLQPASVTAGAGATKLTVDGTNFISSSTVSFNGATRTTTYVSATQVTAALLATDVATAGTYPVTVTNPTPGGGTSNLINFTVDAAVANNPVPTITTLQPTSVTAGAGATTLTVNGTNFISGSVVNYNGTAKTTSYVSATEVTAALLATDVATAGTYPVTVTNPTPGGGSSNSVNFTVNTAVVPAPAVALSPTTLSFPATPSGTASAAQIVTLTNTGNAILNIGGISVTGSNPSVFTQTSTCAATLAASDSCTISIVFTPSSVAAFSASLAVADDAAASPQTVSLSGAGEAPPSFTVSSATSPQTVTAGGTAQYSILVSPQGGSFSGTVTLSASGLPPGATASFSPPTLSPGSASISSQLAIHTAASAPQAGGLGVSWTLTLASLPSFALLLALRRRRAFFTKLALFILATLGAATALTGCGGGFNLGATTAKTYNVTITGTSGAEQQSTTVQLTVK